MPPCWQAQSSSSTHQHSLAPTCCEKMLMEQKEKTKQKKQKKNNSTAQQWTIMTHLERSTSPWGSGTIALYHVTFCASNWKSLPPSLKRKHCIIASNQSQEYVCNQIVNKDAHRRRFKRSFRQHKYKHITAPLGLGKAPELRHHLVQSWCVTAKESSI